MSGCNRGEGVTEDTLKKRTPGGFDEMMVGEKVAWRQEEKTCRGKGGERERDEGHGENCVIRERG